MGKELCLTCAKELGFMKYKPKKEWGVPEGNMCGDCFNAKTKAAKLEAIAGPGSVAALQVETITKDDKDSAKQDRKVRDELLRIRTEQYKLLWEKNGIVQFKNERIAILKRQWGAQVEFIVAFDDVTKEGYELKAIDEGKTQEGTFGNSGGVSSYYYFQKGL